MIYLHVTTTTRSYVKVVASKSRVAPVKQLSIPRLELVAALILARLIGHVKEALELDATGTEMTCWTDSRVTQFCMEGREREWKQFVQHRVNEIRSLVPADRWRDCDGKDNPADVPSRGANPLDLSKCALWLDGPNWLTEFTDISESEFDSACLPEKFVTEVKAEEKRKSQRGETSSLLPATAELRSIALTMKPEDYGDLQRLLRVTTLVLKFVRTIKLLLKGDT